MGAEVPFPKAIGREAAEGPWRQAHIGGIQQHQQLRAKAADEGGEIFRRGAGIDGEPIGVAEGAGKDGPQGVIAMARISNAKQEVHEGGKTAQKSRRRGRGGRAPDGLSRR
jgi:hypothetical protein